MDGGLNRASLDGIKKQFQEHQDKEPETAIGLDNDGRLVTPTKGNHDVFANYQKNLISKLIEIRKPVSKKLYGRRITVVLPDEPTEKK